MNTTFQNSAQVLSIGIFFTLMIVGLSTTLSTTMVKGLTAHGIPQAFADHVGALPPVSILFAAFLGYNPIADAGRTSRRWRQIPAADRAVLTGHSFFSDLISAPFHAGLIGSLHLRSDHVPGRRARLMVARQLLRARRRLRRQPSRGPRRRQQRPRACCR